MPITLNGSGTVTGISAGGLPDGVITRPEMGYAGAVLQVVNFQTGAVATGTTIIPIDDTIPQNTEGNEYMALAITPTNASSKLLIEVTGLFSNSAAGGNNLVVALFQDSTATALATIWQWQLTATSGLVINFKHYMTAGTTSSTTFKVRAGGAAAGTTTFNGAAGARYLGGAVASSITITELAS